MVKRSSSIFLFLLFLGYCNCLYIERLTVPSNIQSNASDVILDCEYQVNEWERQNGFVLKWYINSINLVYQWIPPRPPQVLGSLRGHVDPTYRASSDPWKEHRALRILKPSPSLSGTYSCTVATFDTEDNDSAKMLIWAPPQKVELEYWRPSEYFVNITCVAYNMSPMPTFRFYLTDTNGRRHAIAIHGRKDEKTYEKSHFTSHSWGLVVYAATTSESRIGCSIFIPGTAYFETREKIYYPDIPIISTDNSLLTTAKSYPPEEGAVRLPSLSNKGDSLHSSNILATWLGLVLATFLLVISNLEQGHFASTSQMVCYSERICHVIIGIFALTIVNIIQLKVLQCDYKYCQRNISFYKSFLSSWKVKREEKCPRNSWTTKSLKLWKTGRKFYKLFTRILPYNSSS